MASRPPRLRPQAKMSRFKLVFPACALLMAILCYYTFITALSTPAPAAQGSLSLTEGTLSEGERTGFTAALFDYFGALLFLLPLVPVHAGFLLYRAPFRLRDLNLFRAGLYILGVDLSILGLTALFSAAFTLTRTGGGGILGDFFLIYGAAVATRLGIVLIALLLTLTGLTLMIGRSPLAICEALGALVFRLLGKKDSSKSPEPDTASEKNKVPQGRGRGGTPLHLEGVEPRFETAPDTAERQTVRGRAEHSSVFERKEPEFGGPYVKESGAQSGAEAPLQEEGRSATEDSALAAEAAGFEAYSESRAERTTIIEDYREEEPAAEVKAPEPPYVAPVGAERMASVHETEQGPATIISRNEEGASDAYAAERGGVALEDKAAAYGEESPAKPETETQGPATIIMTTPQVPKSPEPESQDTREEGVSTLITHHVPEPQSTPAPESAGEPDNEVHSYIFRAEPKPQEIAASQEAPALQEARPLPVGGQQGAGRILNFSDFENTPAPSFEVGEVESVPPALPPESSHGDTREAQALPTGGDYGTDAPLQESTPPLSEKDLPRSYLSASRGVFAESKSEEPREAVYLNATRGVFGSGEEQPAPEMSSEEADRRLREGLESVAREVEEAQKNAARMKTLSLRPDGLSRGSTAPAAQSFTIARPGMPEVTVSTAPESARPERNALPAPAGAVSLPESYGPDSAYTQTAPAYVPDSERQGSAVQQHSGSLQESVQAQPQYDNRVGSLDNSGFLNRPHNSSSSNLPGYLNPSEEVTTFTDPAPVMANISAPQRVYDSWRPDVHLLSTAEDTAAMPEEELRDTAETLNRALTEFNVRAHVVRCVPGPVITRYELALDPGIRSSAVSSLSTDISRKLKVETLRVIDAVPGTDYVGVEVPNRHRKLITLGSIMLRPEYQESRASLPVILGVGVSGEPIVQDLAKSPHLLICGTTGSGKSVGLHALIMSLVMKLSPAELRFIMVDPKRVELGFYSNLPHLITPIISDVEEKTGPALKWCVEEMERRYRLLEGLNVRNLKEYNEKIRAENAAGRVVYDPAWNASMGGQPPVLKPLPFIVVCVEEYADLMSQTKNKKNEFSPENCINRLAAKSRAAGIHMILATQTPRTDVVTSSIKANVPSRLAFTVQSGLDSRVILDENGAEKLLGNGDMLFKFMGGRTTRAHCGFVDNSEVARVVAAWHEKAGDAEFIEGVTDSPQEEVEIDSRGGSQQLDALFDLAAQFARDYIDRKSKNPAISDFQSTLGVGYPRAKKIFAQLEREGVLLG